LSTSYSMRDPTAELSPVLRPRRAPPNTLQNKVIGVLSISKERSSEFLDTVTVEIATSGARILRFEKPTHTKPAPAALIQQIVERCDVAVVALAD